MTFPARVEMATTEDLYFNTEGRVQNIYVQSGDAVQMDQVIATLDTRGLELDRSNAQDALDLAKQQQAQAEVDYRFDLIDHQIALQMAQLELKNLQGDSSSDPLEVAVQELAVRQAELALQQMESGIDPSYAVEVRGAEAALQKINWALADAQISAPFAGQVLLYEGLKRGNVVQAFTPVAALVDPEALVVQANLVPADLENLQEGMGVRIYITTPARDVISGTIRTLPQPFGTGTSQSVVVVPSNPDDTARLRAGTNVDVTVSRSQVADALWLPPDAVQGYRDNYYVRLADGSERPVTVGVFADERVEITSGLALGDEVLGR